MNTNNEPAFPDDLNPALVGAIATFIGRLTGLTPPPTDAFPPEWQGHLRELVQSIDAEWLKKADAVRAENAQLAAFVVAVGGVWEPNGTRSVLTGELSLAESIQRDAAIAAKAAEAGTLYTMDQMREFLVPDCKPGGCASIGCEGGFYCFNADGTPKPGMTPEQQEKLRAALTKVFAPTTPCECRACLGDKCEPGSSFPIVATRMILCAKCGNKRCPKANDHRSECTNSNEPGQPGSAY